MKNSSLKRFIFTSSAAVYGDEKTLPKQEDSTIKPLTPYAIDKFAAEKYTVAYNSLYGIPTSCVRFFNVYGPKQNPSSPYSGVISIVLDRFKSKILKDPKEFIMYGDGSQTRDFVYVEDVVEALDIVSHSEESKGNVYNVGTGVETSLNDLIASTSLILGETIDIKYLASRDGDIERSFCSIEKLKKLGYKPRYSIEDGLREYIEFLELKKSYLSNIED